MPRILCATAMVLCGCGPEYEVVLVLPDAESKAAAVRAELAVLDSLCPDPMSGQDPSPAMVVKAVSWSVQGDPPDIGELDSGSYGMYGRVRDVTCAVRWAGCVEALLREDGDARIEIELERVTGPGCLPWEICDESGRCACGDDGDSCSGTVEDTCCPGGCADLTSDPANCGSCGAGCPGTECALTTCEDGECGADLVAVDDGTPCSDGGVCGDGRCSVTCTPGETEDQACGLCGTQYRQCGEDGQWGVWGDCETRGECQPGDFESDDCGDCGTMSRTCGETCWWSDWSACTGEGECSRGDFDQIPCGTCGTQSATCSIECRWQTQGSCRGDLANGDEACEDGDVCTADSCDEVGECVVETCEDSGLICCGSQIGCGECCGDDARTCDGDPGTCLEWTCRDTRQCQAVAVANGTDPTNDCDGNLICCDGSCSECCGNDVSTCGQEPRCADWSCQAGDCTPAYEAAGNDPEGECADPQCCDGNGECTDACG